MALSPNTKKLIVRIVFFLVYLLVGAAIFHAIELPHEKEQRARLQFQKVKDNFTKTYNISDEDIKCFLKKLKTALKLGFDLQEADYHEIEQWHFMNAFVFAGNVVTTIGYGHIVPTSNWGQLFCILYALFGIPLTGLTLRSVGNRISEEISIAIKMFERKVYNRETEKLEIKAAMIAFCLLTIMIVIPAIGFSDLENWSYLESVYFCFVTLSTIGFGYFVPGSVKKGYDKNDAVPIILEFLNLIYMVVGLAVMSGVIVSISGVIEEKTKNIGMPDPLETLRAIQVGNLNSKAMKKLGYSPKTSNEEMRQRIPAKTISSSNARGFDPGCQLDRSQSADNMDFQGPTPILHLNKSNTLCDGTNNASPGGSPNNSSKPKLMFNNKVVPVASEGDVRGEPEESDEIERELAPNNGDDRRNTLREKAGSRNELVVKAQITPVPTPRSSPAPSPALAENEHLNPREEASLEIERRVSSGKIHSRQISEEHIHNDGLPPVEETGKGGVIQNGFPGQVKTMGINGRLKNDIMEMKENAQQPIDR